MPWRLDHAMKIDSKKQKTATLAKATNAFSSISSTGTDFLAASCRPGSSYFVQRQTRKSKSDKFQTKEWNIALNSWDKTREEGHYQEDLRNIWPDPSLKLLLIFISPKLLEEKSLLFCLSKSKIHITSKSSNQNQEKKLKK